MSKPLVYLAGPIAGHTFDGANSWREEIAAVLPDMKCLSPLRGKEYLRGKGVLHNQSYDDTLMSTGKAIVFRDNFDVHRADALFVNLLPAEKVSIGTQWELAWAYQARIPTIVCMQERDNMNDHAFVREAFPFIVPTLDAGVDLLRSVLA